jgi:hypothetical protein
MPFGVSVALTLAVDSLYIYDLPYIWGGRSSAGRALDCGSSGRGFKSRRSPSQPQPNPKKIKGLESGRLLMIALCCPFLGLSPAQ